jgi:hypothetical protein
MLKWSLSGGQNGNMKYRIVPFPEGQAQYGVLPPPSAKGDHGDPLKRRKVHFGLMSAIVDLTTIHVAAS